MMAMLTKTKKPPRLFYIAAGVATIGALFAMTFYMMDALAGGVFAWWAYLPVTLFMITLLTVEQALFGARR